MLCSGSIGGAVAQPLLGRLEEPDTAMHMVVAMLPDWGLASGRTRRCLVRRLSFVGVSLLLLATAGCSVNLQHRPLDPVTPVSGDLALQEKAQNMTHKAGWGTITLFAIPVARVTVNGQADEALAMQVKSALEHAGYSVQMVADASAAGGVPYLECEVNRFKFRNYTWLFPLVFNWGKVDMTVRLTSPGQEPWEHRYVGKATGFYSFEKTVNKALTRVLNEMVGDLVARQQTADLRQAPERVPAGSR
jgi:hypothetical protein